ncbi:hypothetical protein CHGG_05022 [Chaetomium globosum CBS 148.51]|uniref:Uncharacterized protein n=1 Tax=Chaetomium globosum (strain ATCC 6205 / CBS 148.51 / DSM 1962 / NBRC 6347 / NRRL 1970) TaxID=306901 RepID=Q2GZM4_CHAGB|nr:uncharacterized protein CHGG_05022 [Chaetomium globosum CBS 148.51]EAQ88403.1 hypothetical protein CHGG_05022 [Chaetomium globosum CBS 148.51]
MPRQTKRPREVVDLTGGDENTRPAKSPRHPSASNRSQPAAPQLGQSSSSATSVPNATQRHLENDEPEPSTQDLTQSDDGPQRELYGSFDGKIVGVRYYNGMATAGEVVICKREPSNQIWQLSPLIIGVSAHGRQDNNDITIEAILIGEKGFYDCPIRMYIYGTGDALGRASLEERLKKDKLVKATQLKQTRKDNDQQRKTLGLKASRSTAGFAPAEKEEVSLAQLAQTSQTVNFRAGGDIAQTLAMDEDQLAGMPQAEQPDKVCAKLLPYQLQGLAWLTAKENPVFPEPGSPNSVQLWKRDAKGRYVNIATNFTVAAPPDLLSGGILADDMGLGKTLQVISLIMTGGPGSTLIVAPVGVMSNWEQQIKRHVSEEHLPEVLIYHGASRQTAAKSLNKFGVVITSYGTLTSDTTIGGPLSKLDWRRIVLDEGHTIRNAKTKAAEAACKLKAKSRLVLTGTPIVNNIKDLHSLVKFLHITGGIEQSDIFNTVIARPLALGETRAEALLQSLMKDVCLRRRKDMKFVDLKLPAKTEYIHRITFWAGEKKKYEALLCNHWTLCKDRITDLMKLLEEEGTVLLNDENRALLQQALQLIIESQEECPVCMEHLTDPVITHCKHSFCRACISRVIEIQHKCPMCRAELAEDKLVEPAPEHSAEDEEESLDPETKSSKTEALLKILQATLKNDGSKVIIFSQWTSMKYVQTRCRYSRISTTTPATRIMPASLSVCSVGLNLVSADTVVLADSWWAPAIEDQAVDRVHRLGQTRPTTVWRLVMEGTVEERVLDIQGEKRELVNKAFQEKQTKQKKTKETRMADILKLLA